MERDVHQSRDNLYEVYHSPQGTRFLVLEGLASEDLSSQPILQQLIHEHLSVISGIYWAMLISSLAYVAVSYVGIPLRNKCLRQ